VSSETMSQSAMEPWSPARRWAAARRSEIMPTCSIRRSRLERRFPREQSMMTTRWSGTSSGEDEPWPARQRPSLTANERALTSSDRPG
jgi:hypothetical protein